MHTRAHNTDAHRHPCHTPSESDGEDEGISHTALCKLAPFLRVLTQYCRLWWKGIGAFPLFTFPVTVKPLAPVAYLVD
jgi:hypothetical protein